MDLKGFFLYLILFCLVFKSVSQYVVEHTPRVFHYKYKYFSFYM